ncbi:hypothetical protein SPLC1_S202410 [Arthrospira platensis C1]|nr:hypothetical protein SPLC1_S202410 [Arthrospira platensis C1]
MNLSRDQVPGVSPQVLPLQNRAFGLVANLTQVYKAG